MTIFEIISNIIFSKNKNCLNTVEEESEFQPYLVNRWLSMYSADIAKTSNIINKYLGIFDTKKELFNLFCSIFPRVPYKKITYFKKNKEQKNIENEEIISLISRNKELSKREIREYVNMLNTKEN